MTDPRPDNVRAYFDRHSYTESKWEPDGGITAHVWDAAEKGQHLLNAGCPCNPIVWPQGCSVMHEFDPTAVAPLPKGDSNA